MCHKCAVLTRRFIRGEVLFDLFDVFDSSHGLVPIDSIDVQTLTTALLSTHKPATFQVGPTRFGLLLIRRRVGRSVEAAEKRIGSASGWGVGKFWQNQFLKTKL